MLCSAPAGTPPAASRTSPRMPSASSDAIRAPDSHARTLSAEYPDRSANASWVRPLLSRALCRAFRLFLSMDLPPFLGV